MGELYTHCLVVYDGREGAGRRDIAKVQNRCVFCFSSSSNIFTDLFEKIADLLYCSSLFSQHDHRFAESRVSF